VIDAVRYRMKSGARVIAPTMTDPYIRPDFKNIALITIDVQRDFLDDGVCAVPGTTAVLPREGSRRA
jgi:hypothetical protein